ncbi:MAG: deoxyribonuclease V, partial [Bacteroidota bacterium]
GRTTKNTAQARRVYQQQKSIAARIITTNQLPDVVKYIGGCDVAYDEPANTMIGAVVVLDAATLEVLETAHHKMEITFPYVPGLFSFREIPSIVAAFQKLKTAPDVMVCDAHGIAHPRGVGMAAHLGVQLGIPTIGCAKKRLIGNYKPEQLAEQRGSQQQLFVEEEQVGVALRTQNGIKPMFVSIGHKIDITTATKLVLELCPAYRLPETTRQADQLVNRLLKCEA